MPSAIVGGMETAIKSRKRGRKAEHHRAADGTIINGLARRPSDGRWRIIGTAITFTEPDEALAIHRFRTWQAKQTGEKIAIPVAVLDDVNKAGAVLRKAVESHRVVLNVPMDHRKKATVSRVVYGDEVWAFFREQILTRPDFVAEKTGVAKLAWFDQWKPPTPVPELAELEQIWSDKFNSSPEQKRKCPTAFKDFCEVAGIAGIRDIKPETVVAYRDAVYARNLTGKSQSNLFTRVRRYLAFFRDRAIAIDEINQAMGYLGLLTPNETTVTLDPKPVDTADWKKLLAAADGDDKVMVLLMLNCAMYLQEVIKLRWEDIKDGCLVTHRAKTGKCVRVAVLWKETLDALSKVKRRGPFIFYSYAAEPLGIKGAEKRFRDLRDAAKVDVTSSQLRDGAYTAAVEANVTTNLCQLLVGHRSGLADHYVKRRPSMVAPACDAIHRAYFAKR
jgi:integrase